MSKWSSAPRGDPRQPQPQQPAPQRLDPVLDQEEICSIEEMVHACSRLARPIGHLTDDDGYPPPPSPDSRSRRPHT
ncbi:hypothetical protein STVA_20040 [Allostella vacuolata]|nr:hypothetical protein STVA_20040 [Stella vacuolata]